MCARPDRKVVAQCRSRKRFFSNQLYPHWTPVFAQALPRNHAMPRPGWRGAAGASGMARIISGQPQGKGPPPGCGRIAARAVQRAELEGNRIARLHPPFQHRHAFGTGGRHGHVCVRVRTEGGFGQPARGQHLARPQVRPGNAAQGCLFHRIDRRPEADGLAPFDKAIWPVLMPGRGPGGARFLDQDMVMEHLHPARSHQRRRDLRHADALPGRRSTRPPSPSRSKRSRQRRN